MKGLLSLITLIVIALASLHATSHAQEKKRYVRYAEFIENTEVELSDGSQWMMEKGDCFPIHMFKDQQTRVILQLANATFSTAMYRVQILPDREEPRALASYRKMLGNYRQAKEIDRKTAERLKP